MPRPYDTRTPVTLRDAKRRAYIDVRMRFDRFFYWRYFWPEPIGRQGLAC